jgi:glyoxylase-like metal-dependent hydrolase (beta-lactamase superfamily II)
MHFIIVIMEAILQVYPDIYQLKIPLPDRQLSTLNAYVIKSEAGAILIDTGWNTDQAYQALISQLRGINLTVSDLKIIVLTHFHPDHIGLIDRLSEDSPAIFIQHAAEHDLIKQRRQETNKNLNEMETWLVQNGMPPRLNSEMNDLTAAIFSLGNNGAKYRLVKGGETLSFGRFNFEIVWTPGHSPGMICLYEPEHGLLFSADHVLAHTTPNISLFIRDGGNPLGDYLDSLNHVAGLPLNLCLPAHGDLITDLPARVTEIIAHHEERLKEILSVLENNSLNAYQLAEVVPWSMDWQEMPPFHQRFALTETLAHLELLLIRGKIVRKVIDGIFEYQNKVI